MKGNKDDKERRDGSHQCKPQALPPISRGHALGLCPKLWWGWGDGTGSPAALLVSQLWSKYKHAKYLASELNWQ